MPTCFHQAICDLTHLCQVLLNYLSYSLKNVNFLHILCPQPFPLPFLALFHIWWLGPGILFKVFLPLPHLPMQSLLVYTLQEEERGPVEEGFSSNFAIAFLKVFSPFSSVPQGWTQQELCPYHRQYFCCLWSKWNKGMQCASPLKDLFDVTRCL